MEQVLYRLHVRLLTVTNRIIGPKASLTIEWLVFLSACISTLSLFFLHVTYVTNSSQPHWNCIIHGLDRAGLYDRSKPANESFLLRQSVDLIALKVETNYSRRKGDQEGQETPYITQYDFTPGAVARAENKSYAHLVEWTSKQNTSYASFQRPYGDYLFSFHRGHLILTQEPHLNRSFNVLHLSFPDDLECLGPPPIMFLVNSIGHDIIMMNWIISAFGGVGHFYNVKTKELFNFNYAADFVAKKGVSVQDNSRRVKYDINTARQHMKGLFSWGQNSVFTPVVLAFQQTIVEVFYLLYELLRSVFHYMLHLLIPDSSLSGLQAYQELILGRVQQLQNFCSFRLGIIFSTTFLFFISTTLVSFILRQTQEKMLRFTYLLQYHITHQLPYLPLVFSHVIDSLVFVPIMMGIYFFLFEFFSDQLLAFLVLLVVWMGEVFSLLSLRSKVSIRYFPRFFVCYFSLFHIYFFCFPFGFSYLALLSATLCMLHLMIHLWNSYEVPAYYAGRLSPHRPRLLGTIHSPPASLTHPASNSAASLSPRRNTAAPTSLSPNRMQRGPYARSSSLPPLPHVLPAIPPFATRGGRSHSLSSTGSAQNSNVYSANGLPPLSASSSPPQSPPSTSPDISQPLSNNNSSSSSSSRAGNGKGGTSRHSIVLSNIYESVEARRQRLHKNGANSAKSNTNNISKNNSRLSPAAISRGEDTAPPFPSLFFPSSTSTTRHSSGEDNDVGLDFTS